MISKLAYVFLLVGIGGFLWSVPLYTIEKAAFEIMGKVMLAIFTVGIILGGIGGKKDEYMNQ